MHFLGPSTAGKGLWYGTVANAQVQAWARNVDLQLMGAFLLTIILNNGGKTLILVQCFDERLLKIWADANIQSTG